MGRSNIWRNHRSGKNVRALGLEKSITSRSIDSVLLQGISVLLPMVNGKPLSTKTHERGNEAEHNSLSAEHSKRSRCQTDPAKPTIPSLTLTRPKLEAGIQMSKRSIMN